VKDYAQLIFNLNRGATAISIAIVYRNSLIQLIQECVSSIIIRLHAIYQSRVFNWVTCMELHEFLLSKFTADVWYMLSLYYSRCITTAVRYDKTAIGFIFAQYGKILSRDFNIGLDLRSRLNILPYWAQKNAIWKWKHEWVSFSKTSEHTITY
jgi:hypothetical protein